MPLASSVRSKPGVLNSFPIEREIAASGRMMRHFQGSKCTGWLLGGAEMGMIGRFPFMKEWKVRGSCYTQHREEHISSDIF